MALGRACTYRPPAHYSQLSHRPPVLWCTVVSKNDKAMAIMFAGWTLQAVLVALEQLALDHPVDLGVHLGEILALDGVELTAPQVDDLLDLRVGLPGLQMLDGAAVVLPLDVQRAGLTPAGQPNRPAPGDVVADLTDGADGIVQREVAERHPRL